MYIYRYLYIITTTITIAITITVVSIIYGSLKHILGLSCKRFAGILCSVIRMCCYPHAKQPQPPVIRFSRRPRPPAPDFSASDPWFPAPDFLASDPRSLVFTTQGPNRFRYHNKKTTRCVGTFALGYLGFLIPKYLGPTYIICFLIIRSFILNLGHEELGTHVPK